MHFKLCRSRILCTLWLCYFWNSSIQLSNDLNFFYIQPPTFSDLRICHQHQSVSPKLARRELQVENYTRLIWGWKSFAWFHSVCHSTCKSSPSKVLHSWQEIGFHGNKKSRSISWWIVVGGKCLLWRLYSYDQKLQEAFQTTHLILLLAKQFIVYPILVLNLFR